jgi:hypothetical protein
MGATHLVSLFRRKVSFDGLPIWCTGNYVDNFLSSLPKKAFKKTTWVILAYFFTIHPACYFKIEFNFGSES